MNKYKVRRSDNIENQLVKISDLRQVSGIGEKTIERIKDMMREAQGDTYTSKYDKNMHLDINKIHQGDCLELMNGIPDKSVDMVLCDLPYGTTACKWDTIIPFEPLWGQYKRIIKDNGAIVLTANQPFTSTLVMSNTKWFKYSWVWDKITKTNHLNARKQPLRRTEDVIVFYKKQCTYNPQGLIEGEFFNYRPNHFKYKKGEKVYGEQKENKNVSKYTNYPDNVLVYSNNNHKSLHPTQKPAPLFEYLIDTYTNKGDLVLDNCIGSGTTAIAAINTNRNYIGIELDEDYCKIAKNRVNEHISNL